METGRQFLKADGWREWQRDDHETEQRKGAPAPPMEKPYPPDAALLDLMPPHEFTVGNMPLREVIDRRRSRRRYSGEPLSLEELSFLLWATQGVVRVGEGYSRRTVPSGGARHPFETYLVINHVLGIKPGLYRYLPLEHKLLLIREDDTLAEQTAAACAQQQFIAGAAVVFVWTAIPYRTEWRYSILSGKIIAVDAGHLCENLYLAAGAIGAGTCAIGAYFQDEMDALLGVDGEDEFVIYAAPVGKIGE